LIGVRVLDVWFVDSFLNDFLVYFIVRFFFMGLEAVLNSREVAGDVVSSSSGSWYRGFGRVGKFFLRSVYFGVNVASVGALTYGGIVGSPFLIGGALAVISGSAGVGLGVDLVNRLRKSRSGDSGFKMGYASRSYFVKNVVGRGCVSVGAGLLSYSLFSVGSPYLLPLLLVVGGTALSFGAFNDRGKLGYSVSSVYNGGKVGLRGVYRLGRAGFRGVYKGLSGFVNRGLKYSLFGVFYSRKS